MAFEVDCFAMVPGFGVPEPDFEAPESDFEAFDSDFVACIDYNLDQMAGHNFELETAEDTVRIAVVRIGRLPEQYNCMTRIRYNRQYINGLIHQYFPLILII